jgi:hypothetical protein
MAPATSTWSGNTRAGSKGYTVVCTSVRHAHKSPSAGSSFPKAHTLTTWCIKKLKHIFFAMSPVPLVQVPRAAAWVSGGWETGAAVGVCALERLILYALSQRCYGIPAPSL